MLGHSTLTRAGQARRVRHCQGRRPRDGAPMRWWRWSWRWLAAAAVAVIAIAAGVDRLLAGALSPVSDPLTAAWSAPLPAADDEQARLLAENARLRQRLADLEALAGARAAPGRRSGDRPAARRRPAVPDHRCRPS